VRTALKAGGGIESRWWALHGAVPGGTRQRRLRDGGWGHTAAGGGDGGCGSAGERGAHSPRHHRPPPPRAGFVPPTPNLGGTRGLMVEKANEDAQVDAPMEIPGLPVLLRCDDEFMAAAAGTAPAAAPDGGAARPSPKRIMGEPGGPACREGRVGVRSNRVSDRRRGAPPVLHHPGLGGTMFRRPKSASASLSTPAAF
jgi:hypothetical protein